jgi:hypothetical protein
MSNINIVKEVDESYISETDELRNQLRPDLGDVSKLNKIRL